MIAARDRIGKFRARLALRQGLTLARRRSEAAEIDQRSNLIEWPCRRDDFRSAIRRTLSQPDRRVEFVRTAAAERVSRRIDGTRPVAKSRVAFGIENGRRFDLYAGLADQVTVAPLQDHGDAVSGRFFPKAETIPDRIGDRHVFEI